MSEFKPGSVSTCRHCGKRIVLVNWSTGPDWTHQPEGAAFQDGQHRHCHRTVAEPDLRDKRPHSRACGHRPHEHGPMCSTNCPTCHGRAESYKLVRPGDTLRDAFAEVVAEVEKGAGVTVWPTT